MKFHRRHFLRFALGTAAASPLARAAFAYTYPARPVHIVVGFAPGSASDIAARLIAQALSERLGQQFVVDNKPGAGSNIATEFVVRSAPDGYTLFYASPPNAINATLYQKLNFDPTGFEPVAILSSIPNTLTVRPDFSARPRSGRAVPRARARGASRARPGRAPGRCDRAPEPDP